MSLLKLSIIIPVNNEEAYLLHTLETLSKQTNNKGMPLKPGTFQVVIVNNASTDKTGSILKKFTESNKSFTITIIEKAEKSCVASRIIGYNFVINNPQFRTDILASADADISFHPQWVNTII
mgnify:FL=1